MVSSQKLCIEFLNSIGKACRLGWRKTSPSHRPWSRTQQWGGGTQTGAQGRTGLYKRNRTRWAGSQITCFRYNLGGLREVETQWIWGSSDPGPGPPETGTKAVKLDPVPAGPKQHWLMDRECECTEGRWKQAGACCSVKSQMCDLRLASGLLCVLVFSI